VDLLFLQGGKVKESKVKYEPYSIENETFTLEELEQAIRDISNYADVEIGHLHKWCKEALKNRLWDAGSS
jgi:hypothetical protein